MLYYNSCPVKPMPSGLGYSRPPIRRIGQRQTGLCAALRRRPLGRTRSYLTNGGHYDTMTTMNTELKHIKITADSHKKLRLLAAITGKTMMGVIEQLVNRALEEQAGVDAQGIQVQNLPKQDAS